MRCPICEGESTPLLVHSGWKHDQCSTCGHAFLVNPPSDAELSEFYSTTENALWNTNTFSMLEDYLRDPAALGRYYQRDRLRHLPAKLAQGARVLDIGCGSGVFLATLRDAGCRVVGQDLSSRSVEAGRKALGIELVDGPLSRIQGPFDLITSYDVIEHWARPIELLESIRPLCDPATKVVIRTPNHDSWLRRLTGPRWLWYMPPAHINLFTAKSLVRLTERAGFRVNSVCTLASSYLYFAAYYLAGGRPPRTPSLAMPRWKETSIWSADNALRAAISPLLIAGGRSHTNPILEVHASLRG